MEWQTCKRKLVRQRSVTAIENALQWGSSQPYSGAGGVQPSGYKQRQLLGAIASTKPQVWPAWVHVACACYWNGPIWGYRFGPSPPLNGRTKGAGRKARLRRARRTLSAAEGLGSLGDRPVWGWDLLRCANHGNIVPLFVRAQNKKRNEQKLSAKLSQTARPSSHCKFNAVLSLVQVEGCIN